MKTNTKKVNKFFKDKNQESASEHTPTPWEVTNQGSTYSQGNFIGDLNSFIDTDAAFIVRAVNAHEELLAALKREHAVILSLNKAHMEMHCTPCVIIAKAEGK